MHRDSTVVSISLVATGVATFIFLGNPEMDNYYPAAHMGEEKSLPQLRSSGSLENRDKKLAELESEVAALKQQMEILSERMAGNGRARAVESAESNGVTLARLAKDMEPAGNEQQVAAQETVDKGWVEETLDSLEALVESNADLAGAVNISHK